METTEERAFVIDRVSGKDNAVGHVRLPVRPFLLQLLNELTYNLIVCMFTGHDRSIRHRPTCRLQRRLVPAFDLSCIRTSTS